VCGLRADERKSAELLDFQATGVHTLSVIDSVKVPIIPDFHTLHFTDFMQIR